MDGSDDYARDPTRFIHGWKELRSLLFYVYTYYFWRFLVKEYMQNARPSTDIDRILISRATHAAARGARGPR